LEEYWIKLVDEQAHAMYALAGDGRSVWGLDRGYFVRRETMKHVTGISKMRRPQVAMPDSLDCIAVLRASGLKEFSNCLDSKKAEKNP
jgi:hypothetical protein